jgi:hypothetical protein
LRLARGCDRNGTLMRHATLTSPLPIGLLAPAVILLSCRRGLVSPPRCPHLLLAHSLPAAIAAIALAAVTTRTDVEKRVARRVNAPPHAKAFDGSIRCHHVKQNMPTDDRTDDCAFGSMMSSPTAEVQKTTFSDDRRHVNIVSKSSDRRPRRNEPAEKSWHLPARPVEKTNSINFLRGKKRRSFGSLASELA